MRRFLCLWFPHWPTDCWRRRAEAAPACPLVLTARGQGGVRLTAIDRAAAALRLVVGMPLADARALVPSLTAADAAPEADAKMLAELADWCTRYSPWSATDGNDGIRLDVTGCAHLFGGEAAMLRGMVRRLRAFGLAVRPAIADTPAAAWGWARHRPRGASPVLGVGETQPLLPLPTAALRIDQTTVDTLRVLGLHTVGAVADLPRAPLGRRLGVELLLRLDRMFGRADEPISPHSVTEPLVRRMAFAEPIGRREDIDAAAERLTLRLCRDMALKGQGARRLVLGFYRVDGGVQHLTIGTSSPSHTPTHILRLFAERLETVAPGFGIEAMVLEATETEPLSPRQAVFDTAGELDPAALAALIDRLQNRLGSGRVVQLVPVESHVPERAERQRPAHAAAKISRAKFASPRGQGPLDCETQSEGRFAPREGEVGDAQHRREGGTVGALSMTSRGRRQYPPPGPMGRPPPQRGRRIKVVRGLSASFKSARPLTLLPIPEPIEAIAPVPDDPPLSFRWRRNLHRVAFADGPERIGPEWWLPGQDRARDYYRVEDADGRRFWLYREGLYGAAEPPRWFLHGFFP